MDVLSSVAKHFFSQAEKYLSESLMPCDWLALIISQFDMTDILMTLVPTGPVVSQCTLLCQKLKTMFYVTVIM